MKYRQLLDHLNLMSPEELDCDVSVLLNGMGEFFPGVPIMMFADQSDVLDQGHPYLVIED